jgi:antitoxin HicB
MRTYTYGARIEPGEEAGLVVTFPDVPEAITQGEGWDDARAMAAEALGLALLMYLKERRPLPEARSTESDLFSITADPEDAAKIAVLEAFRDSGLSQIELARRLNKDPREVRRILDPMHATKLPALKEALSILGRRLVVGVEEAA